MERRPVKHRGGLLSMSLSWYTSVVAIHAARACASGARVERGPRLMCSCGRAWGKVRLSYTSRLIRYVVQETGTVHRSHNGRQTAPSQFRRDTVCHAVCAAAAEITYSSVRDCAPCSFRPYRQSPAQRPHPSGGAGNHMPLLFPHLHEPPLRQCALAGRPCV